MMETKKEQVEKEELFHMKMYSLYICRYKKELSPQKTFLKLSFLYQ